MFADKITCVFNRQDNGAHKTERESAMQATLQEKQRRNPPDLAEAQRRHRAAMAIRINANLARLSFDDLARLDIAVARLARGGGR